MTDQDHRDLTEALGYFAEARKYMDEASSAEHRLDDWPEEERTNQVKTWLGMAYGFTTEAGNLLRKVNRNQ